MTDPTPSEHSAWLDGRGRPARSLAPLAGDVSRRSYLRVHHQDGSRSILAVYPAELTDVCRRFTRTTDLLAAAAVRVPRILERDCERGRMLLEDAGDRTLYDRRGGDRRSLEAWLEEAARVAEAVGRLPLAAVAGLNPPLDRELLRRELDQAWELVLAPRGLTGTGEEAKRLRTALDEICARLDGGRQAVCHRDFMARNLIPAGDGELVVIDHQDLRRGPATYDLASLLNDSLFASVELESRLLERHLGSGDTVGDYRRAVVQRTLKACGTYAAFARRGSNQHLRLVAPTLGRAARALARLEEGSGLAAVVAVWRRAGEPRS